MCGILAVIGKADLDEAQQASQTMIHRGPDERGVYQSPQGHILIHERLSIMDLQTGRQPLAGASGTWLIHNGEIYNYKSLFEKELEGKYPAKTSSDSEVILAMYEKHGVDCLQHFDGVFAFALLDGEKVFVARDPIGVKPLFYGEDKAGNLWFASEMKALQKNCIEIKEFMPGHYYTPETGFIRWYEPSWFDQKKCSRDLQELKESFEDAVVKRLMSDAPLAVLLSGGLDSSLVASIAVRHSKQQLKSFSIGVDRNSPDLIRAREVAEFLGTEHHEVVFTEDEGIEAIPDVIKYLETYDITTIRAGTPMYLLSKYIKKQGIKVVLSGEGADEVFGGYLYFRQAPSAEHFHEETIRRIKRLYSADVLRADRSTMAQAIEARVPFLDRKFLDVAMHLDPQLKIAQPDPTKPGHTIEKYPIRQAFVDSDRPYLPDSVLWRQKEQFSDGVGYSWVDRCKAVAEERVTDEQMTAAASRFPHNTPDTKEAYMFREIFHSHYPHKSCEHAVLKWIPKWQTNKDPSGRANSDHFEKWSQTEDDKESLEAMIEHAI